MSIASPIRLKITQNGTTIGYVETLDLLSGISAVVTGPIAKLTATGSGTGGGDADTLGGHPPSYFATAAQADLLDADVAVLFGNDSVFTIDIANLEASVTALLNRVLMWPRLGIAVQTTPPASGITHAQWLAGNAGAWGWIRIP